MLSIVVVIVFIVVVVRPLEAIAEKHLLHWHWQRRCSATWPRR